MGRRIFEKGNFVKLSKRYFELLSPDSHLFSPTSDYYVHGYDGRTVAIYDDRGTLRNMSIRLVYRDGVEKDQGYRFGTRPQRVYRSKI